MQDILHNSRILRFRAPQGAVPAGEQVRLMLYVSGRFLQADATLHLWARDEAQYIPMQKACVENDAVFTAAAEMPSEPGLAWYYFVLHMPDGETLYYGGESGEGACYSYEPPGYQITLYDPAFETPRWFREGIMYQIFPDRFRKAGDTRPGIQYHTGKGRRIRIHENWDETPFFLPEEGAPDYQPNDFFCGTLMGIRKSLPYLASLGITCIYLNPIFESASNHRYDTGDYKRVDPILGTGRELKRLARKAKLHGIRLMLDGVFSHTGADSAYFNKYGRYDTTGAYQSEDSSYRNWYTIPHGDEPYAAWWGFRELPEVNELTETYTQFILGEKDSVLNHWAAHGITSWRLDVADELPDSFIADMRKRLKSLDQTGVLLGEVWEDASNKISYGERRKYALGRGLDSVMNYPFRVSVLDFLLGVIDAHKLRHILEAQRERYPKPFYYAAMNMLSTHDSIRALNILSGTPAKLSRQAQFLYEISPEDMALGKKRLLIATALQLCMPGVPSVYYGDEAGMTGMADPFNRRTYPWGREDMSLLRAFRAFMQARAANPALRSGYCRMGSPHPDVFLLLRFTSDGRDAFRNSAENSAVLFLCNRGEDACEVLLTADDFMEGPDANRPISLRGSWTDAYTGFTLESTGELLQIELPPLRAFALQRI